MPLAILPLFLFLKKRPAKIGLICLSAMNNLEYLKLSVPISNSIVNKVVNSFLFLQLREWRLIGSFDLKVVFHELLTLHTSLRSNATFVLGW